MPTISVIVPVYKVEEYLPACIRSILSQTYRDFELILVDDGSPDRCGEICDEFAKQDERIRVIHQANGGASRARNTGLEAASGDWICFIDADDLVEDYYLQDFCKIGIYQYDIIIQGIKSIQGHTEREIISCPNETYISLKEFLASPFYLYAAPYAKLYKSSIIRENNLRFMLDYTLNEDSVFYYSYLYYIHSACLIDKSAYIYRADNPHSLTHQPHESVAHLKSEIHRMGCINRLFNKAGIERTYSISREINILQSIFFNALNQKNGIQTTKDLLRILRSCNCYRRKKCDTIRGSDYSFYLALRYMPTWILIYFLKCWALTITLKERIRKHHIIPTKTTI